MGSSLLRRVEALEDAAPARRTVLLVANVRGRSDEETIANRFPEGAPADVDLVWIRYPGDPKWGTAASDGQYSDRT